MQKRFFLLFLYASFILISNSIKVKGHEKDIIIKNGDAGTYKLYYRYKSEEYNNQHRLTVGIENRKSISDMSYVQYPGLTPYENVMKNHDVFMKN